MRPSRYMLDREAGYASVPADPPPLPGEILIDLTGLEEHDTAHPIDEIALDAFRRSARMRT